MYSFEKFMKLREADDISGKEDIQNSFEPVDSLNDAVKLAVKKGYKNQLVKMLKSLGDEEINRELEGEKGLGDMDSSNSNNPKFPEDEVVPSKVDMPGSGLEES